MERLEKNIAVSPQSYLKTIGLIFAFWLIVFWLQRLSFIYFFRQAFRGLSTIELASTFVHGFLLDLSAVCYLAVLPVFALSLQQLVRFSFFKTFLFIYTILLLPVIGFISVFDMGIYHDWRIHLNYRAINYLRFVNEAAAFSDPKVNRVLTVLMIIQLIAAIVLLFVFFRRASFRYPWSRKSRIPGTVLHLAAFPLLFVGIRGGIQLIPLNESSAYFSTSKILNDAAVNVTWNAVKKFADNRETLHHNPYQFLSDSDAHAILHQCYETKGDSVISVLSTNRPDIVLFVLESYTADLFESLGGDTGITDNLDTLIHNGILFSRIYAQGHRTDQGLACIFSGWPATPDFSIIMQPEKYDGLKFLPAALNQAGYHCSFFYGGELEFANMKAFFLNSGISDLHDKSEFAADQMSAKWGAHDEFVMEKQCNTVGFSSQPFFSVILTLSSHEPFEVPGKPKFPGDDVPSKFRNSCYYTDHCIGNYMREARKQAWYHNTLFIFVADHAHVYPRLRKTEEPARFHIPLIFYGDVIRPEFRGKRFDQVGMQVDIPATLLSQLGLPHAQFEWSNDLLHTGRHDFSFYTFDSGLGWVENDSWLYHYFEQNQTFYQGTPRDSSLMLKQGLSFTQILYGDYISF